MTLRITALGVGHGDAFLLDWQGHGKGDRWTCLVDGGSSPRKICEHLRALKINRLDLLVGTHPDSDHIGGLTGLANQLEKIEAYWAPPLPAFERHLWLFGPNCKKAITRCRSVEESLKKMGTQIFYPVEGFSSSPFGPSGPRIHVLSPAARLVRHLITSDDVLWLFTSEVMPLGWMLEAEEEEVEQVADVMAIGRALASGALRPEDISDHLRLVRPINKEEKQLPQKWAGKLGIDPEYFGDSVLNNTSIVLWIEVPNDHSSHRVLLPGDQENWTYLIARHPRGLNADVFKAPHHGGRLYIEQDPAHDEVYSHVRPRVVLISTNGQHSLPRSSIRQAAIRWGAAILCTSDRTQETIVGAIGNEECCHKGMNCEKGTSQNVELTLDTSGIRSNKRSCHPGLGQLPGPVIEVRQHIVNPSPVLDHLAEHELRRHISWIQKKLREVHEQRKLNAAEMVPGSKPISDDQLISLAPDDYRTVLAAHLKVILAKGRDRGAFWAQSDGYRESKWDIYSFPTKCEINEYLESIGKKAIVLFPDAADKIHRDQDSLLTQLEINGLAKFMDASLHFPEALFREAFWPAVIAAFKNGSWHCFLRESYSDADVALSCCKDRKQFLLDLALKFPKDIENGWDRFKINDDLFPFNAPILIGGKIGERHDDIYSLRNECVKMLHKWLDNVVTIIDGEPLPIESNWEFKQLW